MTTPSYPPPGVNAALVAAAPPTPAAPGSPLPAAARHAGSLGGVSPGLGPPPPPLAAVAAVAATPTPPPVAAGPTAALAGAASPGLGAWSAAFFPLANLDARVAANFGAARGRPGAIRRHKGIDIWMVPVGTPIRAANSGVVIRVHQDRRAASGYGVTITTLGGHYTEAYFHMRDLPTLAVGDRVAAGDTIGHVGVTGRTDGPHLHFQVMKADTRTFINPRVPILAARAIARPYTPRRESEPNT